MLISVKVDNGPSPIIVNIIDAKSPDEARMRAYNYAYYGDQFSTEEAADQDTLEAYTSVVKPRELRDRRRISSGSLEGNWHSSNSQGEKSMATPEEIKRIARLIKEDIDGTEISGTTPGIEQTEPKSKVRKWLLDHNLLHDGFLYGLDGDIPTEISIKGERWQLSFEGRTDEIAHSGEGLDSLLQLLRSQYKVIGLPDA